MKTTVKTLSLLIMATMLSATSCRKKDPVPEPEPTNDEEVITTMNLNFTDSATNATVLFGFEDRDGDGGNSGIYFGPNQSDSVIVLDANKTYNMEIVLLDKTKNPATNISDEVNQEGKDHMFFFNSINPTGSPYNVILAGSNISLTYTDLDAGSPQRGIGLKTRIRTYASTGGNKFSFTVTLKHQLDSKNGTITPGETDIFIPFKIKVN